MSDELRAYFESHFGLNLLSNTAAELARLRSEAPDSIDEIEVRGRRHDGEPLTVFVRLSDLPR